MLPLLILILSEFTKNLNRIFQNNVHVASEISVKNHYFDNKEDHDGSDPSVSVSINLSL